MPQTLTAADTRALIIEAVRVVTENPTAVPRDGQGMLHDAIRNAMEHRGHVAAQAPTGSGKSLASLAPAFMAAIEKGERTVISTDSLALMGQLQDKDVDTVSTAARIIYPDASVQVAFLKGVSNYLDPDRVVMAAQKLTAASTVDPARLYSQLEQLSKVHVPDIAEDDAQADAYRRLVLWALEVYSREDDHEPGDRHSCPIEHTAKMWQTLSASSAEASDGKRVGVTPKIELARIRASEADIVVTNHSMLAVQAAKGIGVILGNTKLGVFDHIIVDEAHTLPGHVRAQGAEVLSGGVLERVARTVGRAAGNSSSARSWRDATTFLADELDGDLRSFASDARGGVRRLTDGEDVIGEHVSALKAWAKEGMAILARADDRDPDKRAAALAAKEELTKITATAQALTRHRSAWARWIEKSEPRNPAHRAWWEANVSPVDVAFLLRDNLWGGQPVNPKPGDEKADEAEMIPVVPPSVSAISATMPSNFPMQAGLRADLVKYPSPFQDAYAASSLYIPKVVSGPDFAALSNTSWGRAKFDTFKHASWAVGQIIELVKAAGGRSLILAAKTQDGKMYAEALRRELPELTIYDQWTNGSGAVADWRADIDSVMVGTKSMATGIDPAGDTCQLVVIDRVPRSPANPIDDARVEALTARTGDEWAARDHVYAIDAALLLKQAAGRLLRAAGDTGMCAVLDPRLLKADARNRGPFTYQERTRQIYMESLYAFGTKLKTLESATAWLREHRG